MLRGLQCVLRGLQGAACQTQDALLSPQELSGEFAYLWAGMPGDKTRTKMVLWLSTGRTSRRLWETPGTEGLWLVSRCTDEM